MNNKKTEKQKKQKNVCRYCNAIGKIVSLNNKKVIGPGYMCWNISFCTNCNKVQ
ncbi:MAG: hypothetical protein QXG00_06545 [Candidatus Woesearchaeota archaeon]